MQDSIVPARAAVVAALFLAGVGVPSASAAQARPAQKPQTWIPAAMRAEHEEIHFALLRATKVPGRIGRAARELAAVLDPHFVREEQIALPPLGLLAPLARGELTAEMRALLPLTDSLRVELPQMLREHEAIRAATLRMGAAARAAGNTTVKHLAETLARHAQTEEQVSYPAAVLAGEVLRARIRR